MSDTAGQRLRRLHHQLNALERQSPGGLGAAARAEVEGLADDWQALGCARRREWFAGLALAGLLAHYGTKTFLGAGEPEEDQESELIVKALSLGERLAGLMEEETP